MIRLKTHHITSRTVVLGDLKSAGEDVKAVVAEINHVIRERLNPAIDLYNEKLALANAFRDEVVADIRTVIDPEGHDLSGWIIDWENIDLEDIVRAAELEDPEVEHAEELENLPIEPEVLF